MEGILRSKHRTIVFLEYSGILHKASWDLYRRRVLGLLSTVRGANVRPPIQWHLDSWYNYVVQDSHSGVSSLSLWIHELIRLRMGS